MKVAPQLDPLIDAIAAHKPLAQLMSGSGSTLFALCRDRAESRQLARTLRRESRLEGCKVFAVRTWSAPPAV